MSPLFRHSSPAASTEPAESTTPQAPDEPVDRARTPGKGRPTPKRKEAVRRRAPEPPANTKEGRKRMRERAKAERAERFEGMQRGDDRYLMARDKGPVRRLVRDLIDSRRNVGPLFFGGVLVVVILSSGGFPLVVRTGATFLWFGLIALMVLDGFLISRLVRRTVSERFPTSKEKPLSLVFYAILRSISFRKIRNPKPQVKVGDKV